MIDPILLDFPLPVPALGMLYDISTTMRFLLLCIHGPWILNIYEISTTMRFLLPLIPPVNHRNLHIIHDNDYVALPQ